METSLFSQSLKNAQAALTTQEKVLKTQQVMLFGLDGAPNGKCPLTTKAIIDLKTGKSLEDILEYNKPYVDTLPHLSSSMSVPSVRGVIRTCTTPTHRTRSLAYMTGVV